MLREYRQNMVSITQSQFFAFVYSTTLAYLDLLMTCPAQSNGRKFVIQNLVFCQFFLFVFSFDKKTWKNVKNKISAIKRSTCTYSLIEIYNIH